MCKSAQNGFDVNIIRPKVQNQHLLTRGGTFYFKLDLATTWCFEATIHTGKNGLYISQKCCIS